MAEEEVDCSSTSVCLLLTADGVEGDVEVKPVKFARDERGDGSIDDAAADLLGIHGDRVRCFHLPFGEKKLGFSLHMYIDLQGVDHKLPHNSNASQLWLISNLPEEPPHVSPSSIHGPVLLSATNFKTDEYIDMTPEHWQKIKAVCRAIQPNAQFVPYEPLPEGEEPPANDDEV